MLDWSLLQKLLVISIACSSVTVVIIQKTKLFFKSSNYVTIYSIIINIVVGFLFSQTFSDIDYIKSLWVGLFSFLGADTLYKTLEGKLSTYTDLTQKNSTDSNNTNTSESEIDPSIDVDTEATDVIGEIKYE